MKGPKNGIIKARFVNFNKKNGASLGRGALLISVGQAYHEGEKLAAALRLINHSFDECHIMVCDTLQRINIEIVDSHCSDEDSYNLALDAGKAWIDRNREIIERSLDIPVKFFRWDYWLSHPDYIELKREIDKAYIYDSSFRSAIINTTLVFIKRFQERIQAKEIVFQHIFDCCVEYLKEECPIILPLWSKLGYNYVIYPSAETEALTAAYRLLVPKEEERVCKWLSLKFKRYAVLEPA
ncbi:MAG: tRNA-dependent cyclodipeptide synthase [Gammaproteobacteria bacterium]|nr:tRNA-dependent cyclodipeptide synthase [Gammaproteobacteria bacterium]